MIVGSMRSCGDEEIDRAVFSSTMEEANNDCGWLEGPMTAEQLTSRLGSFWIPSRRFGVRQGGKIRNVDDFSESLVNQACGLSEKVSSAGVDEIVAMIRLWVHALDDNGM
eukprot:9301019-Karenia_brevis.AAC.1